MDKGKFSHTKDYSTTMFTTYSPFQLLNVEIYDKIKPYKKFLINNFGKISISINLPPERPVKSTILLPRPILVTELIISKRNFFNIISLDHASEIFSWIDHGFAPQTFWNICYGHARTAKVKGTDEIIGGLILWHGIVLIMMNIDGWKQKIVSFSR
ncbi:hypothetical protein Glove_71g191 [Diversispora epigaea]|uniref:Uncharacterized protein n=1 Tax=Diversispora epigaea TaxID=1348612 RepID=A0A397J9W3_9GLOM|nr:hypothetical protein Glove_71g191 [Diversispora epigaea]